MVVAKRMKRKSKTFEKGERKEFVGQLTKRKKEESMCLGQND